MRDARLDQLAKVIVEYSAGIQAGQLVRLVGDPVALPLLEAVYERLIQQGAHVSMRCVPDSLQEIFFEHANQQQLEYVNPLDIEEVKTIDASIGLWAETNTKALTNVDPKRQATRSSARKPVLKIFMERASS